MADTFDVAALLGLGRVHAVAPSPDGRWLAVAVSRVDPDRQKFVSQLWRVALDGKEAPTAITRGRSSDRSPCFRSDGALAFLSDRPTASGEKNHDRSQVWILPPVGEPAPLTDEPLGVIDFRLAGEGGLLALLAPVFVGVGEAEQRSHGEDREKRGPSALHYRGMPVRLWDRWIGPAWPHVIACDAFGGNRRDLTPDATREHLADLVTEHHWDVSASGDRIAVARQRPGPDRITDSALEVIDVATGRRRLLGEETRTAFENPRFSPDGRRLACTRYARSQGKMGKPELWLWDLGAGIGRAVAPEWDAWPILHVWTSDGRALIAGADDHGSLPLFRVDVGTNEVARITSPKAGGCHDAVRLTSDGRAIVGLRHRLLHPPEPFLVNLASDAEPRILANLSGFTHGDGEKIARWEHLHARSSDGAEVASFLVLPADRSPADAPLPAMVWIHGGPIGAFQDGWHWRWNPLVPAAAGYAVVMPNPRGSTGYGQDFVEGIHNNAWGAACYRDVLAATEAAARRPEIDGERIGAMGGSFGGYMSNWIGSNTDRYRCLITHASLYDLTAFYGATDYPAWMRFEFGTDPYENRDAFERHSPAKLVSQWRTPTLIIHGERDYRVPIGEALALFEALQLHGVESELLVFPDENHWILKPRNIAVWYGAFLEFADRYLRSSQP